MSKKEKTFRQMVDAWDEAFAEVKRYLLENGVRSLSTEDFWHLNTVQRNLFFDYLELHTQVNNQYNDRYVDNAKGILEKMVERKLDERMKK